MHKRTMTITVACILAFCFALVTTDVSVAKNMGAAELTLTTKKAKKPSVFPHKAHQDQFPCAECHHTKNANGSKGPYVEGQEGKCESCHNKEMANKKLASFKNAAHANCKECHKKMKKEGKKAPTKCTGCHVKKKK